MDALYVAIIIAVIMIAGVIAYMAWTGGYEGMNPITVDNVDKFLRPSQP
jgi:hypothetical protein